MVDCVYMCESDAEMYSKYTNNFVGSVENIVMVIHKKQVVQKLK